MALDWASDQRIVHTARAVRRAARPQADLRPVIVFNASTRIGSNSYNAAYALIAAWALRLAGVPVIQVVCQQGMSRCVLGTDPEQPDRQPPCRACLHRSRTDFTAADIRTFSYQEDPELAGRIAAMDLEGLIHLTHREVPLGELVLPSLRWRMRLHHLHDDPATREILRQFLLSAWNVYCQIDRILEQEAPQALIVFNGQFFPEATARWAARRRDIRSIAHEVGLQPFSAFFTDGEATAYPIQIPEEFQLDPHQEARLQAYLEKRFRGQFSMAGIRFWPEMKGLEGTFLEKLTSFRQVVPVFTNVIFDTSQPHANTVFPDMFAWLETVLELADSHPETLFVIRAHPDETRPGKESRETVEEWVKLHRAEDRANIAFIPPREYFSSYELIQRSKFVMIYNSTIGLEASILGAPVLCAGKARFTQYPTVFFPQSISEFKRCSEEFLAARSIPVPEEFARNSRRFLYYQLFFTSLPFDGYLTHSAQASNTRFRHFPLDRLRRQNSSTIDTLLAGILEGGDFLLGEA